MLRTLQIHVCFEKIDALSIHMLLEFSCLLSSSAHGLQEQFLPTFVGSQQVTVEMTQTTQLKQQ